MPTLTMRQDELGRKELEKHENAGTCVDIRVKKLTIHVICKCQQLPVHGKNENTFIEIKMK